MEFEKLYMFNPFTIQNADSQKIAELGARLFRFKKAYESIDSKQNALKKKIEAIRYEL